MARRPHAEKAPGMFSTLVGRPGADVSGSTGGDLRGQLIAAFGVSKRTRSGEVPRPNVQAAADGLGVSTRTVQRWLADPDKQHYNPRAETAAKIADASRRVATTKRGRAKAVRQAKADGTGAVRSNAGRIKVTGDQGPERAYARLRTVNLDIPPELYDGFVDAYVDGGEEGAMSFLRANIDSLYAMEHWYFGQMDSVNIEGIFGGH